MLARGQVARGSAARLSPPPTSPSRHRCACPPPWSPGSEARHAGPCAAAARGERFPVDYPEAIRQAQDATMQALADGATLIEVEFPTTSLAGVSGDGEGANEMNYSLGYLRQYLRCFAPRAATTRVFFPDDKELRVAREGSGMDPAAGSWILEPTFDRTAFQMAYLSKPNGFLDAGLDFLATFDPSTLADPGDELFVAAYPHFDPREMIAVERLWRNAARDAGRPIITFNAELDRIRTGYYPALFYPKIGALARDFLPLFTTAYYVHNFKGSGGGALFRAYPGPWQVYARVREGMRLVHSQKTPPTLREVALDILPRAAAAAAAAGKA